MKNLKFNIGIIAQISAVFIGTIVGAGLASGQEIAQFFTTYGFKSFIGLILCMIIYIALGSVIIKLSIKFRLHSYEELIKLVSPGPLGNIISIVTSFFIVSSSAIILAGSGALLNQYFKIPKIVGIIIMTILTITILLRDTEGLVEINSFIVPSLIIVISTIFILYMGLSEGLFDIKHVTTLTSKNSHWLISSILYAGFNILCCSGVLVPLSNENKYKNNFNNLISGLSIGAIILTIISSMINLMLMLNINYIHKYEIPLLYTSSRFGKLPQVMLLIIIWCEMFSTEISDVYSIAKTLEHSVLKISYNKSIFLVILIALPISQLGFKNLISFLYPAFGFISIIFMVQCMYFYMKNR